ncbi:hypothetical protein ACFVUH_22030 [Kitasatospora sp. NPDC058032]|uniref:hypothetical protein n=1 Tax=Kitasatospora sp. NPDC058032 TaxID=3346307 RepID=UPI0036DABCED
MEYERELVRRAREAAVANGGSVLATAQWLGRELGLPGAPGEDVADRLGSLRSIVWQAFRITGGQAILIMAWSGLGRDGRLDEDGLEREVGRLLPRTGDLDHGAVDRDRFAHRMPRRMLLTATQDDLPVHLPGESRLVSYGHSRLLVLRGRATGPDGDGALLDVEFQAVRGMRVRPLYRDLVIDRAPGSPAPGADAEAVAAMDALLGPDPGGHDHRLLLADRGGRDFVVCHRLRVHRLDPAGATA